MKHSLKTLCMTLVAAILLPAAVMAQKVKSIGDIKLLENNADFVVTFEPNTVQVAALERDDNGNVGGVYLWDGKDGLFLFYGATPSWDINALKVGDYVSGTFTGTWEKNYWDVLNLDGDAVIDGNGPLNYLKTDGKEMLRNGNFNKFGLYELTGTFYNTTLTFVTDDGMLYAIEDNYALGLGAPETSHGTLRALFYQGGIANYMWPCEEVFFSPDDEAFTPEDIISDETVGSIADLKRRRLATDLVFENGYKAQIMAIYNNAYFLWDGKDGILLYDAGNKISSLVAEGSTITGGTLHCDTNLGNYGVTGSQDLVVDDYQDNMSPVDRTIASLSPADFFGYLRLAGEITTDEYGNYVISDGTHSVVLEDRLNCGAGLSGKTGKKGTVNVLYHPAGNRLFPYGRDFFNEGATGIGSVSVQPAQDRRGVWTIGGTYLGEKPCLGRGIYIHDGKKTVRK